jgi:hypothetical protein
MNIGKTMNKYSLITRLNDGSIYLCPNAALFESKITIITPTEDIELEDVEFMVSIFKLSALKNTVLHIFPEIYKHPKHIMGFVRNICESVNNDNKRFIIITYNDFIVKELSNILVLSGLTDKRITVFLKEHPEYTRSMFIKKDEVRNFELDVEIGKGLFIEYTYKDLILNGVLLDSNWGLCAPTFDEPIDELNAIQDELIWGDDEEEEEDTPAVPIKII